jgi:hypothetical protein
MTLSAAELVQSFQAFSDEDRRAAFEGVIRAFVSHNGRDETIRLLLENAFGTETALLERQIETLAALTRIPKDAAAALLRPVDPESVRLEDCLTDAEVDRILAGAGN